MEIEDQWVLTEEPRTLEEDRIKLFGARGVAQGRERVVVGDIATSSINFHDLRHTTRAPTGSAMLSRPCRSSAQFQHNAVESSPRVLQVPVEPLAQLVEHLTFNQGVLGSSPRRLTTPSGVVP